MEVVADPPSAAAAPAAGGFAPPAPARTRPAWQIVLAGLALFALALAPRLIGLEQHLTADDQDWIRRATRFGLAIERGSLRDTFQGSQPGIPVLWLASLAIGPQRLAELGTQVGNLPALEKLPAYLGAIYDARRALAITSAGLTVLSTVLIWRLLGPGPAVLAGLLLADEPFLVAHGRLFHADPLLAQLMVVSVLAALIFFDGHGGWGYLLGSGLAAGLAFLTKAPGIFLFGFVPLLGLAWSWRRPGRLRAAEVRALAAHLALWGAAAGVVYVLLWPALWVSPFGTIGRLALAIRGQSETARTWGNFFLGQVVTDDPGPLFYPLATVLRLSPITTIGLLTLLILLMGPSRLVERWSSGVIRPSWLPLADALIGYVVLFTLMMTLSPKKIDRYLLPAFPPLVILAALGLWLPLRGWLPSGSGRVAGRSFSKLRWVAVVALGLGQAALVAAVQPYPLSFYNPLLGGIGFAREAVVVGWGEGTDQVAAYLDREPNASEIVVSSLYNDLITPLFRGTGVSLAEWQRADYLADYVNMDQRRLVPTPLQPLVGAGSPVFTARINGLEYVRVYRIPRELREQGGPSGAPLRQDTPRP